MAATTEEASGATSDNPGHILEICRVDLPYELSPGVRFELFLFLRITLTKPFRP